MSFDIGVFYTEKPHTDDDAGERYMALCDAQDLSPWIEPNPRVAAFLKELTDRYPQIDDVAPEDDCPWSVAFDVSEGHVLMPIRFDKVMEAAPFVERLAKKHGLVCFNPQTGTIVTAPPGIHVDEADAPEPPVGADAKRWDEPFVDLLDELLKPRGFKRRGRMWRKDGEKAVTALHSGDGDDGYNIDFCAWFKALGEVKPTDVKPDGENHILYDLVGRDDFVPESLEFRLLRAFYPDGDYADDVPQLYGTDEAGREIASYFEPREALTTEWRVSTLREAMEEHVLPWLDRVDAGDQTLMEAEEGPTHNEDQLKEQMEMLKAGLAKCRQLIEEGMDDDALIAAMRKEFLNGPWAVVVLSAARGWSVEEAREKVVASELWWGGWMDTDQRSLDEIVRYQEGVVMHPDGTVGITKD